MATGIKATPNTERSTLEELLAESLDKHMVSEDHMEALALKEVAVEPTMSPSSRRRSALEMELRAASLQLFMEATRRAKLSNEVWFHAARIYDVMSSPRGTNSSISRSDRSASINSINSSHSSSNSSISSTPTASSSDDDDDNDSSGFAVMGQSVGAALAQAAAIWLVCTKWCKMECLDVRVMRWLTLRCKDFAVALGEQPSSTVQTDILKEERNLLLGGGMQYLPLPSLWTWICLMFCRFDICTQGIFSKRIEASRPGLQQLAAAGIFRDPSACSLSVRSQAAGLVALALIGAQIIPARTLLPEDVELSVWQENVRRILSCFRMLAPEQDMPQPSRSNNDSDSSNSGTNDNTNSSSSSSSGSGGGGSLRPAAASLCEDCSLPKDRATALQAAAEALNKLSVALASVHTLVVAALEKD